MDDRQFEQMLEGFLRADSPAGAEEFREGLLARCLAVLDAGSEGGSAELDDADLELLAAAGDAAALGKGCGFPDNRQ